MKKLRVVVAEDNDILRATLTSYLRRMAEVTLVGEAKDGLEALKCVDEVDPDLLILDIIMTKMSGWQVLDRLHQQQARVKVIVFSTYAEYVYGTAAPYPGIISYLGKENPEALTNAVRQLAQQNGHE